MKPRTINFTGPRTGLVFWAVLILVLSLLLFSRCFDYGLVNLDDYGYLQGQSAVVRFSGWRSVVAYFTDVSKAIWMPLTWISYAIDHGLFGEWYGGFHIHSVLIHAANAILVWRLLCLLFASDRQPTVSEQQPNSLICLLAALAWSIHPLRCESVVFLSSRKDVLSFFWELLALLAWIRGSRCAETLRRSVLTAVSVILFILGAMCKPSVMTFPILCLLLDTFIVRQVRPLRYIVPVVLMVGLGWFAGWQQSAGGAMASGANESLLERLAVAAAAFGIYVRNTAAPLWLAAQCVKQWPAWPHFLMPGVALSLLWGAYLVIRGALYWAKRHDTVVVERMDGCPICLTFGIKADYVYTGVAWFALSIAPMLGIANFGYHAHADRFTYIPSFGLAILLAYCLSGLGRRFGATKTCLVTACALSVFATITWRQVGFWQDDAKLFKRTVEIDGDGNALAHRNLGAYYFEMTHELEKARYHFDMAGKANMEMLIPFINVYLMTLMELGQDEEMDAVMRRFEEELVRKYGKEWFIEQLHSLSLFGGEARSVSMFMLGRVASCLGRSPSLEAAKKDLEMMRECQAGNCLWQYLMWRYLTLSGEKDEAEEMLKQLLDSTDGIGYLQFRYLRSGKSLRVRQAPLGERSSQTL